MAIDVKGLLAYTLLALCKRKALEKITVTELLNETGVGRRTFYVHLRDKNDLIAWVYKEFIVNRAKSSPTEKGVILTRAYFEVLFENKTFMEQACRMTGQNCLSEYMYAYAKESLAEAGFSSFKADFYSVAIVHVTLQWILGGMKTSPDDFAKELRRAVDYRI